MCAQSHRGIIVAAVLLLYSCEVGNNNKDHHNKKTLLLIIIISGLQHCGEVNLGVVGRYTHDPKLSIVATYTV